MYAWFWRSLPGPWPLRLLMCLLAFAAIVVLLFFLVFPAVEPLLPFTDVTVEEGG